MPQEDFWVIIRLPKQDLGVKKVIQDKKAKESIVQAYNGKTIQKEEIPKNAFSQLFDEMLKAYIDPNNEYGEPVLTKKEIGERLGISQSLFQKRINWEKPSTCRDTVIAICMILKADLPVINEALYLHNMPGLDPDYSRDAGLLEIVYNYSEKPLTLDIINERLRIKNIDPLYIPHRGNKKVNTSRLSYKVLGKKARIFEDDLQHREIYNSLCLDYHPSLYRIQAEMWIEDIKDKSQYELSAYTDGYRFSKNDKIEFMIAPVDKAGYVDIFKRKTCDPNGEYYIAFREMSDMLEMKLRVCLSCLIDTRNYKERISARIMNDELHIFCETFNYSIPELGEYYLTDYFSGEYKMYKSKDSMFMKWYLSPKEYKKYYSTPIKHQPIDLNRKIENNSRNYFEKEKLHIEKKLFDKQKKSIEELYRKLINGKIKIRNIECLDDNPYSTITYYGLDEMFEYTEEMTEDKILLNIGKESIIIPVNNENIKITPDDVCFGFELGCEDIQAIAQLKQKYKNLKNVIQ